MIQPDIKIGIPHRHDSYARQQRAVENFVQRSTLKASRRDERMAAAQDKRLRKNAKRARDAVRSEFGQLYAREAFSHPVSSVVDPDELYPLNADGSFVPQLRSIEIKPVEAS